MFGIFLLIIIIIIAASLVAILFHWIKNAIRNAPVIEDEVIKVIKITRTGDIKVCNSWEDTISFLCKWGDYKRKEFIKGYLINGEFYEQKTEQSVR